MLSLQEIYWQGFAGIRKCQQQFICLSSSPELIFLSVRTTVSRAMPKSRAGNGRVQFFVLVFRAFPDDVLEFDQESTEFNLINANFVRLYEPAETRQIGSFIKFRIKNNHSNCRNEIETCQNSEIWT